MVKTRASKTKSPVKDIVENSDDDTEHCQSNPDITSLDKVKREAVDELFTTENNKQEEQTETYDDITTKASKRRKKKQSKQGKLHNEVCIKLEKSDPQKSLSTVKEAEVAVEAAQSAKLAQDDENESKLLISSPKTDNVEETSEHVEVAEREKDPSNNTLFTIDKIGDKSEKAENVDGDNTNKEAIQDPLTKRKKKMKKKTKKKKRKKNKNPEKPEGTEKSKATVKDTFEKEAEKAVFIGNLNFTTQKWRLLWFLRQRGVKPTNIVIIVNARGESKGFGYAHFKTDKEAEQCCALSDVSLDGRTLNLDLTVRKLKKTKPRGDSATTTAALTLRKLKKRKPRGDSAATAAATTATAETAETTTAETTTTTTITKKGKGKGQKSDDKGCVLVVHNLRHSTTEISLQSAFPRSSRVHVHSRNEQSEKESTAEIHFKRKEDASQAIRRMNGAKIDGRRIWIQYSSAAKDRNPSATVKRHMPEQLKHKTEPKVSKLISFGDDSD